MFDVLFVRARLQYRRQWCVAFISSARRACVPVCVIASVCVCVCVFEALLAVEVFIT